MASRSVDGRSAGGAVACPHWLATEIGRDVLAAGGNALDAAVAMNAMLAVVYPHMCGLGGDLFLLYAEARSGRIHCLNASGPAPALATVEALGERGLGAVPARGPLTATVPGAVAGWRGASPPPPAWPRGSRGGGRGGPATRCWAGGCWAAGGRRPPPERRCASPNW